ncbi:MAG: hypothetical protein KY464_01020 [Gemmatimonadetes bacterium]|nr:hypothetical protein [Gemmatimonadota bacterium]
MSTTQVISSTGGTLSTSAGASVEFPAGALEKSTPVTLAMVPSPPQRSGAAVSSAFKLEPAGAMLARPASIELRFDASNASQAWLASVINVTGSAVQEVAETRVDASTGIVQAQIQQLGTLSAVLPEPAAVFGVESAGAAANRAPGASSTSVAPSIRGLRSRCGEVGNRCKVSVSRAAKTCSSRLAPWRSCTRPFVRT